MTRIQTVTYAHIGRRWHLVCDQCGTLAGHYAEARDAKHAKRTHDFLHESENANA